MGANVIKVEQYKAGANERWLPLRITKNDVTQSSYTITVNRGQTQHLRQHEEPQGDEADPGARSRKAMSCWKTSLPASWTG